MDTPSTLSADGRALLDAGLQGSGAAAAAPACADPDYPLSPAQTRIFFISQLMRGVAVHKRPLLLEFAGRLGWEPK